MPFTVSQAFRVVACGIALTATTSCTTSDTGVVAMLRTRASATVVPKPVAAATAVDDSTRRSLDAMAYDAPTGSSAALLPPPLSRAAPVTEMGDGSFIRKDARLTNPKTDDAPVVLNLSNVPLKQAAKTVLGDLVGVNYMIDPRIDGAVSVQTAGRVSKAEAIEMFHAALRPIGAVMIESSGVYRIVPADQGVSGSVETGHAGATPVSSGVRIVQLRYVSASELARVLEPMVPKGAIVQADDGRNILAFKGSPGEIDNMLNAVSVFDVDMMRGMSFAVVPVSSRQPEKMAEDLKAIFSSENQGPMKGRIRFIANSQLGAVLVATSQPSYLARAKNWIKKLDQQGEGSEQRLHVYSVQNRPAQELADILQTMFADEVGGRSATSRNVSPRSRQSSISGVSAGSSSASGSGASMADRAFGGTSAFGGGANGNTSASQGSGRFGDATGGNDLKGLARALNNEPDNGLYSDAAPSTGGGSRSAVDDARLRIVADSTKNSLLIMANERDYQRIYRVVQSLDVVPSQVMIEAAIAEVSLNDNLQFGVKWQLQNNGGRGLGTFSSLADGGLDAAFPGFNYALKAANIATTLSALNAITKVNVISTPSLMVLDNKTATLQIGEQVPITTQTAVSTVTVNGSIVNSISMRDTGVILSVTPRINESGRVQLEIEQEVSAVVKTTTSNIDSPTIQQRRVKTTVVVNDGEVLALGGMIQDKTTKNNDQLPFLGDIPGIGAAFSSRTHSVGKTELIILITPRVVRDGTESRLATEEYRRKMNVDDAHPAARRGSNYALRRVLLP